jgi:DNA repair protein RadC
MFSEKCERAIKKAFKLMEECHPVYTTGKDFLKSEDTKKFWKLRLANRKNEQFEILFLNNQHQKIACETLFKGTIDSAAVYPRVIIQKVLEHNAAAIILAHNHPSGVCVPSQADIDITKKIKDACNTISVRVLDHIIVGNGTFSFSESGII